MEHVSTDNPLAEKANNIQKISNNNFKAFRGQYDPQINASVDNKQFGGKEYYNMIGGEIKQPIFTSQYLKAGFDYANGDFLNPQNNLPVAGLPYAGIEMGVLQGLMIDKRRADLLKAKEQKTYFSLEKDIQLNNLFFAASTTYANWVFVQKQLKLYDYFIKLAQIRYLGIVELAKIGEHAGIDSVEASINYKSRLLDFQTALIEYQKQTANLNVFYPAFSDSLNSEQFNTPDSLERMYLRFRGFAEKEITNVENNNPLISQYLSKEKILTIERRLKREMIKPKLDFRYNFLLGQNNSDAILFSSNNYKWGAGLSFPLFLSNPRNNLKIANLEIANNKMEMENKSRELNNKLFYLKEAIVVLSQQINNAINNAELSKKLLEAEKLKFYNGESSLFLVNTRENKWLETELKESEYKLKYISYVLTMIYIQGNLNYKI